MRIIEYGYIKPKEIKCNHCGAILEYTHFDFEHWTDNTLVKSNGLMVADVDMN